MRAEQADKRAPRSRVDGEPEAAGNTDKASAFNKASTPIRTGKAGAARFPFLSYKAQSRQVQQIRSPKLASRSPFPLSQTEALNHTLDREPALVHTDAIVNLALKSPSRELSQESDQSLSKE